MSKLKQWVNLPKNNGLVEDDITSIERLAQFHIECEFKKATQASFKVRIYPTGNEAIYSKKEKQRNPNFKLRRYAKQANGSNKKIKLETDLFLPAAGGNSYKIEAKYKNTVVEAKKTVETRRRLYYQVISMKGVPYPKSMSTFEDAFKNEKGKFFIELKEKNNGRNRMDFIKTVQSANDGLFRTNARNVYDIKKYEPYAVAVVFSNYIADKANHINIDSADRSIPSRWTHWGTYEVEVDLTDSGGNPVYLWHNLDPVDDAIQGWLNHAHFYPDGATAPIKIPNSHVSITGKNLGAEGGYSRVKVEFKGAELRNMFSSLKGKIVLDLNIVEGYSGGFSYTGLNLIAVATKAWWDKNSEKEMLQILNHEMGHKVGMVAAGTARAPDKPPHLYGENRGVNDRGHRGPHCANGCNYNNATQTWSGIPKCVMYGATGLYDATTKVYTASPDEFCPDCGKIVRKLDLDGANLPGLKTRF